jgi:hypothetical protein
MGEKVERVKLELKAQDEASGAVERLTRGLRDLQREQRASGEHALESLLKGGGVAGLGLLALEAEGKAAEVLNENLRGVADGTKTMERGLLGAASAFLHTVPLVKTITETVEASGNFWGTAVSVAEQYLGVSREIAEANFLNRNNMRAEAQAAEELGDKYAELAASVHERVRAASMPHGLDRDIAAADDAIEKAHRPEFDELGKAMNEGSGEQRAAAAEAEKKLVLEVRQEMKLAERDIRRAASQEEEEDERQHQSRMEQIGAAGNAAVLREGGAAAEAEIALLNAKYDQQISDLQARAVKDAREHAERATQIEAAAGEEIIALRREQSLEAGRIVEQDARDREKVAQEAADRVAHIYAEAGAQRLTAQHRQAEAEAAQLKAAYDEQLAAINRAELEKLNANAQLPGHVGAKYGVEIVRQAGEDRGALKAKFDADSAALGTRDADRHADEIAEAKRESDQASIGALRAMGELGNGLAKLDAERLEIIDRTGQKIADINKKLREQGDMDPEARERLLGTIQMLKREGALELAAVGRGGDEYRAPEGGPVGAGVRGYGAAAAANASNRRYEQNQAAAQTNLLKEILDEQRKANGNLEGLNRQGGPGAGGIQW